MEKRRRYQNIRPFLNPKRGFLSEVILPPEGRDMKSAFFDSWSDSCLGPGLRRVLHQLWDRRSRTFREGHDCNGRHTYFSDILCTVSGLDYEFNKLEHFLSNRKRMGAAASIRNRTPSTMSDNDMSYLDLAAKSLLELIICLKHELRFQVNVGRGNSFSTMCQTNKLIRIIENKLSDLLERIDDFRTDSDRNLCCERCSNHITHVTRPMRTRLNCHWETNRGSSSYDQDRCLQNVCLDYQPNIEDSVSLNRLYKAHKTGFKYTHMQARQSCQSLNFSAVHKVQNYNLASNKNIKVPSNVGQWFKSGCIKSKNSKDLHNTFMGTYGRLNDRIINERCPNGKKGEKLQSCCCVRNKSKELKNLARYEINGMANASLKTVAQSQHNKLRRKRAGKDNSAISDLSGHNPDTFNNNSRVRREMYMKRKNKQQNGHKKISHPKNPTNMWSKQANFCSTPDRTSSDLVDNSSNISIFRVSDFQDSQRKSKQNLNYPINNRLVNVRKDYSYTNRKQKNKGGQNGPNNTNVMFQESSDRFSSQENISNNSDYKYLNPNTKIKSHITNSRSPLNNQSYFQVNKPYAQTNRTNNKPKLQRRRKHKNNNKIKNSKPINAGVYPSKPEVYRNKRARSNTSKVGNFFKRVQNNLSKIRLFSSKPTKNTSKRGSSESSVSYSSDTIRKGYKRSPKRKEIEYTTRSRYPSRNRVRFHTNRNTDNSVENGKYEVISSSSTLTQLTYIDDQSISCSDESDSVSHDYPYYFERIPSSYEYASSCIADTVPENEPQSEIPKSPHSCDVCPLQRHTRVQNQPLDEDGELADEYEIIFEKVEPKIKLNRPKHVVRKIISEESTSTLSTESSPSSESVSSSLPEYEIIHQPRKPVRRNRLRNVTIIKKRSSYIPEYEIIHLPPKPYRRKKFRNVTITKKRSSFLPENKTIHESRKHVRRNRFRNLNISKKRILPAEEVVVRHSKHKRRRKYIRVGSEKFQESAEKVIDHDPYQPALNSNDPLPTIKNTYSRGTSTEVVQPGEEKFTFHPPVKDTYSRGTSTEVLPLYTKRTSTSGLIRLIQAIGTNTDRVVTREKGLDPIPLKQKTLSVVTDVRSTFTNTDKINVRSAGTATIPERAKPPAVNTATDPLFNVHQKDQTTNTSPEKKKHVTHVGTNPRPEHKLQQATKATDPLYYLGQQFKFTNTEQVITINAQTETPKQPANVSIGTTTTPVIVQDQKTSYEKVKTSSRGNHPIAVKMADKGFQYDTVQHKPAVKTAFTETFTIPRVGKTTQTSFIEKPIVKASVYQVQTQTETVRKPPLPILKQRNPIVPEEIAVVEAEEPEPSSSNPSELSMHLVFEKCQDEIYKRRTNVCKPRCSADCEHDQRLLVCDNIRSRQIILNSLSDCNVSSITQKNKPPHSDSEWTFTRTEDPQTSNFTSDHDLQTVGKVQSSDRTRKLKLSEECGTMSQTNQINKQNHSSINNLLTETDEKDKSATEAGVFDSSFTTFTSCDWKNIAEQIKLNS